jgi:hypothetical protein
MKSIFLVNPISGRGHLDAYARLYSRALLELGYQVVLLAKADGNTTGYLARCNPALEPSFGFISFDQVRTSDSACHAERSTGISARSKISLIRRSRLVWQEEGLLGIMIRCLRVPLRALISRIPVSSVRYQIRRAERALGRRLLQTRLAQALNLPFYFDVGRIRFSDLVERVHYAVSANGHAVPDLVLFLYLDLMSEQRRNIVALDRSGSWPWIGILFHPRLARHPNASIEGYFESKNARGGVFLVPSGIPAYAEATPQLHFALAPDVADLEAPAEPSSLALDLRKCAGKRTIVLQIGSITAHKGIPTLLDVIAAADPGRFFFALVGEVHWESFGEHKGRIRSFYSRPPENVYLSQGYIASERDYNSLIMASDIVYAVYQDFGSSSNSLTKSAGFRRPILVSEKSLMGERVRCANIGAVAPEGDANAILEKLCWLAAQPRNRFAFEAFSEEHSVEALKRVLANALPAWLAESAGRDS